MGALGTWSVHATGHVDPFLLLTFILGIIKGTRMARAKGREARREVQRSLVERVTEREKYVEEAGVQGWQRAA